MPKIPQDRYQKNLDFWETAWSRVKEPSVKIPGVLDYIPDIPKVFSDNNCTHILDLACGTGWLCYYLNEHGFEATGVDISKSAIRLANEFLEKRKALMNDKENPYEKLFDSGLAAEEIDLNKVNFAEQDIFAMDFPQESFDGILINAAFEHLDYARGKEFLSKIKSFMKPGAIMFAVFDKVASGKRGEFEVLEDGTHQYIDEFRAGMFLRNYSDEELKELLSGANWEILDIKKNKMESRIVVARSL
jgi:SAM-dependent methyltransferase